MAALLALMVASAVVAQPVQPKITRTLLNGTGKALLVPVTLRHDEQVLGEITLTLSPEDEAFVDREALVERLSPHVSPALIQAITALPASIPMASLAQLDGASITFDRGALELVVVSSSASGQQQDLSLRPRITAPPPLAPSTLSGYLNVTSILNHSWGLSEQSDLSFAFEGAARFMDMVFEGQASLDGPLDSFICPVQAQCTYAHNNGFHRRATRLVKDLPGDAMRLSLGDVSYWGNPLQRGNDLLGLSVRHSPETFGLNHRLDSASASTLALDTGAQVEVLVNGVPLQRLRLKPGTYRLTDLPLTAGSNDVELVVTTDTGERREIKVKTLNHYAMLAPGKTDWGLAGGVASFERDRQRHYVRDDPVVNAHFAMGLTPHLTGNLHAQADVQTMMAGGGVLVLSPFGLWGFSLAASLFDGELSGYAATVSWEYLPPALPGEYRHAIRAQADYRSTGFLTPGDAMLARSGVLFPAYVPLLRLSAGWTVDLPWSMQVGMSGRYAFANPHTTLPGAVETDVDRWGVTASLTKQLSPVLSGTLYAGYGNERLLSFDGDVERDPEFQIGVRLSWLPQAGTHVRAETDSLTTQSVVSATTRHGLDANGWTTSVTASEAQHRGSTLSGSVVHSGRFEETVFAHTSSSPALGFHNPETHYTSLRTTTALLFADGQFGVGPPVRDTFVLVRPHATIAGSEVIIGDLQAPRAKGGPVLPAVVTNIPSYTPSTFPLDATDLPLGYSLGTASLSINPPYKAGYAVVLGSDAALSVHGTLLDAGHKPLALAAGHATPRGQTSPKIPLFTNSMGRFGIEGLSEGPWQLVLSSAAGPLTYDLAVVRGDNALVNAGTLLPVNSVEIPHAPPPAPSGTASIPRHRAD